MGIQFEKVNYKYMDDSYAINNINLDIKGVNEFLFVVGETGSGKSTLLQHMNALLFPKSGKLTIFDKEIFNKKKKNKKLNNVRKNVGLVFQFPEYQLFEETIIKDVMFGPKNFKISSEECLLRAKDALNLVGIDKTLYERSPFNLSGGQKRRVAIASVLAIKPEILILDEPTRGLDPKGKIEIMNIFKNIHEKYNKTIIIISHDMDLVCKYAKRVLVMKQSKLVFDGSVNKLLKEDLKDLNLEIPTSLAICNKINKELGLNIYAKTEDELIKVLNNLK